MPVQLNATTGGGNVTITAPSSVTGTKTLTVPGVNGNIITSADSGTVTGTMLASATVAQSNLATNVAGNGPAFLVYMTNGSANQSLPTSTYTKVRLDTKETNGDTNTCFNNTGSTATLNGLSVPSYSFMPNIAGYYIISGGAFISWTSSAVSYFGCVIYKNNTLYKGGVIVTSATQLYGQAAVSSVVYMNGTSDYIDLRAFQYNSSDGFVAYGIAGTFLTGALIRSA